MAVDVERARSELAGAREALGETITRLRREVFELKPTILEEAGLVVTMRRYIAQRSGPLPVDLEESIGGARYDRRLELGAYRIAQQALHHLSNVSPRPSRIVLRWSATPRELIVTAGAEGASRVADPPSLLVDWAGALGADIEIDGPELRVRIPLSDESAA